MLKTPDEFMEYFRRNYPGPSTIISSPDYHSPKIYRAAIACSPFQDLIKAAEAALALMDNSRAEEGDPLREHQDRIHGPVREPLRQALAALKEQL